MPSRRWINARIILFCVIAIPTPLAEAAFAQDDRSHSGEAEFSMYCADCHGDDARGNGPRAFGLSVPPPSLVRLTQRNDGTFPRERVMAVIDGRAVLASHGSREMPVWGEWFKIEAEEGLGGAEGDETSVRLRIKNLVDYLISIQE